MIARTPSGEPIICDGCGAAVERVTDDMQYPAPAWLYGPNVNYIVCGPMPDDTIPCLQLAIKADELHVRDCSSCRHLRPEESDT